MMKKQSFFMLATIVASCSLFTMACDKHLLTGNDTLALEKLSGKALLSPTISVNWDNWTDGEHYNVAMARTDFGDINGFTQVEQARTLISLSRLRVTLLKDEYGANGGVITNSRIDTLEAYELNYKIKFHADFDFATAGRIGFGLQIGDGADGEGGTFRLAWDTDANGDSYFKPYAYYADQPGTAGDDFGARYPASGGLTGSVWYNVKMVIKANTKMDRNGRAELYINDVEVLNIPIRWTKDHTKRKISQLLFSNYRAGAGSESTRNANVWFDDFTLTGATPTYAPAWCDSVYTVTRHYDEISETYYHLTEINREDNNGNTIRLMNGHAAKVEGETGTEFARRMDCCVAFNASMGKSNLPPNVREPVGIQIIDGNIVQALTSRRYTLGIKDENELLAYLPWETAANMLTDGANDALTAFIPLIEDHQPVPQAVLDSVGNSSVKHPRQVIAQYDNGNVLVLSCGGRGYDGEGMTAQDLVRILSALDVRFAFNLDGGGSVTTMVNGERITPLIDGNGTLERARPNWLYVKYDHGD
ncbi:phosphodiester glycosidase family protein [Olivibacter sp. SDN3]|uniref:phosphodiester glycosidase family protein n=1 Tax=Olivibacter sp. SDN3 TaxID=2764720 RepID=UPI00165141F3|nr:phosphodiester glycosidase family protein [Olivibacter sp. SDN3]QNL48807.1 phosphodiester glycosidase family protein [Olivibacter sp. SDN3]